MSDKLTGQWWQIGIKLCIAVVAGLTLVCTTYAADGLNIYKKNLHLSTTRKQKLADDITRYRNAANIWDALSSDFSLPHYENNPAVQARINWYMDNQYSLLKQATRAAPYLYYVLQQVKKRHLPAELVLVPLVESGYNPFSQSYAGASGIWQLMPTTASGLGVKQNFWYDGRRDVIASTGAALNYLAYLQSFFDGNWLLAFAAYNTGEGNVLSAIRRNIKHNKKTDFWSLPLAHQTRVYVPSLLALAVIISNPNKYPIFLPPVRNAPYLAQIDIGSQINLKYAASLAGMTFHQLITLNPGFNRQATARKGPYRLILPIQNIEKFTKNLSESPLSKSVKWIEYKIKPGDSLSRIAKKYNSSLRDIRKANLLSSNLIRQGRTILIPLENRAANPYKLTTRIKKRLRRVARNSKRHHRKYKIHSGDTVYMVKRGDSLSKIARRFKLSTKSIRTANIIKSFNIKEGERLVIPTHKGK